MKEIKKTIHNGKLTVTNVPHLQNENGEVFADGEKNIVPAKTLYTLTFIFQYMLREKLMNFDFQNLSEIDSIPSFLIEN